MCLCPLVMMWYIPPIIIVPASSAKLGANTVLSFVIGWSGRTWAKFHEKSQVASACLKNKHAQSFYSTCSFAAREHCKSV